MQGAVCPYCREGDCKGHSYHVLSIMFIVPHNEHTQRQSEKAAVVLRLSVILFKRGDNGAHFQTFFPETPSRCCTQLFT